MTDKNNAPHILRYENENRLPPSIITNLLLTNLVSKLSQDVLSHPCGKINIRPRQELFQLLSEPSFFARIHSLLDELKDYQGLIQLKDIETNRMTKDRLRLKILEKYTSVCHHLSSLSDGGELLFEVSAHYSSSEMKERLAEMECDCKTIREFMKEMDSLYLSFSDKDWVTPSYEDVTYLEQITELAKNLNLCTPKISECSIGTTESFVHGVYSLHSDKVYKIELLFSKHEKSYLLEPLVYIEEFAFFIEISEIMQKAKDRGLFVCIPEVSNEKEFQSDSLYDISLIKKEAEIVPNDTWFARTTPFFFLTGANGGGKTTYLRAIGVNLLFFLSGCPVFAKYARIYPFSSVLTHFPSDERFENMGRLDEEVHRLEEILSNAGECSFLLLNETFSGADSTRGYQMLLDFMSKIKGHFGLYVTHFHDVNETDFPILSVEVDADNDNARTFRIIRKNALHSSFAEDILKKYHLDLISLEERGHSHVI